jgi:hypothetical protein
MTRARAQDRTSPPILFVVDDDVPTLELLREVAAESGWRTFGFTRLAPVREALDRRRPTLMIVEDLPLVVCTAAAPPRLAEITGWAPVVTKPFDVVEIEDILDAAARRDGDGDPFQEAAG